MNKRTTLATLLIWATSLIFGIIFGMWSARPAYAANNDDFAETVCSEAMTYYMASAYMEDAQAKAHLLQYSDFVQQVLRDDDYAIFHEMRSNSHNLIKMLEHVDLEVVKAMLVSVCVDGYNEG